MPPCQLTPRAPLPVLLPLSPQSQYGPLGVPVTPDMAFEVASVTKAVTATAIMLLFMRGFLRLDARLDALAPAILEAIGAPPHFGNVTINQLLHHTRSVGVAREGGREGGAAG